MLRKWLWALAVGGMLFLRCPAVFAQNQKADPSFMHGLGKAVAGATITLPKAVLDGILTGPPVVGAMIGLLGGAARAAQMVAEGVLEMSAGFDPFGVKKRRRE